MDQNWPNYGSKAAHLWIKGGPPFVQRQRGFGIKISAALAQSRLGMNSGTDWGRCAGNKPARGRCWLGQFSDLGDGWFGNLHRCRKNRPDLRLWE